MLNGLGALALLSALLSALPPDPPVEVQRPGEAAVWALDWAAPPDCPTRAELIAAVRARLPALGDPPLVVPRAELRVRAQVEHAAGEWIVRLELSGRHGNLQRSFAADSCEQLGAAVALVAAVALDPVLVAEGLAQVSTAPKPDPDPDPDPDPTARAPPSPESTPRPPTRAEPDPDADFVAASLPTPAARRERPEVGLRAVGGGSYGPTTALYGHLGLGLALSGPRWRWSLDGGGALPRALGDADARGRFSSWWIGSRACYVPGREKLGVPLCAGLEAGQVLARGLAPALNTRQAAQPWLAPSVGVGLVWSVHPRLNLLADVSASVPVLRGSFDVDEQSVAAITPVGARLSLGFELRFW